MKLGKVLFSGEQIRQRAKEIGKQISKDYEGEEILVVGTLKGAIFWMVDVTRNIDVPVIIDFVVAKSYGSNTSSSGKVDILKDVDADLEGKNVLIMEDIVDSGLTMDYLLKHFKKKNPKSIKVCTMLNKEDRREVDVQVDYAGFEVDNVFIVGYGLDYDQKFRNLPNITYIEE